jgi:hypothetical protein
MCISIYDHIHNHVCIACVYLSLTLLPPPFITLQDQPCLSPVAGLLLCGALALGAALTGERRCDGGGGRQQGLCIISRQTDGTP